MKKRRTVVIAFLLVAALAMVFNVTVEDAVTELIYEPDNVAAIGKVPLIVQLLLPSDKWLTVCVVVPSKTEVTFPLTALDVKLLDVPSTVQVTVLVEMLKEYELPLR